MRDPRSSRTHASAGAEAEVAVDRPALAAGELAGGEVTTSGFPVSRRTRGAKSGTGVARTRDRRRTWRHGGAAYPRAGTPGHSKPRGGAHKGRGGKAVLMREKRRIEVERVACTGTSSGELSHGGAEKKVGHHSLSPRPRETHAGATEGD